MAIPVVEYLRNKIYLGAFDYVPDDTDDRVYLTVDDTLPYNNFHHDFGPLSIAHLYRFAVILHDVLGRPENQGKQLVFYSYTDPRARANAATLLASYMIIIQSWQPHQVLAPIAQTLPVMPFRDAGYSVADFIITVQDIVYALWRAKNYGLLEMRSFDLEEYEQHELVENGDLNNVGEHFVAFASPVTGNPAVEPVLKYFKKHNVKLVVRLNSHLYDKRIFERVSIKHVDLVFEDGTCPTMAFVQGFIGAVEGVIREGGKVAVHCRAGLGRTGCLIGAHLIYTYGFTAQEAIAYMRFMRPGMVVGPQQHWLYQHQHEFRDWRRTMRLGTTPDPTLAGYAALVDRRVSNAGVLDEHTEESEDIPRTPQRNILARHASSCLPEPTPGQPRKSPSPKACHVAATNSDEESHYDATGTPTASPTGSPNATRSPNATHTTTSPSGSPRKSPHDTKQDSQKEDWDLPIPRRPSGISKHTPSASSMCISSRSSSHSSSSSSSRSIYSRSTSRRASRSRPDQDAENAASIVVMRQRRNMSEMPSPQQLALAKQLRVASNPSPRRRSRRDESPLKPVETTNQ